MGLFDLRDLHAYGGLLLIALGIVFIYAPAAPIAAGVGLVYFAMRTPGRPARKEEPYEHRITYP